MFKRFTLLIVALIGATFLMFSAVLGNMLKHVGNPAGLPQHASSMFPIPDADFNRRNTTVYSSNPAVTYE